MITDGALIADRYRILHKLGQGGMGQVYLAEHLRMGRKSALKVMNPGMAHDPENVQRFNREAANLSRINHPNVAAVYDFGETPEGLLFLAMEYVDGDPLSKIIERCGALGLWRSAAIAEQVAEALRVAHRLGIVHRDLKPDNIMITRDLDGKDQVKVVDFGIAKVIQNEAQKLTQAGLSIGTPEFMSPEQMASDDIDGRSDIYSLGVITFAMLTGQLPFPAVTTRETLVKRLVEPPARLAEVRGDIAWPSGLQGVMDRVLAAPVDQRYQNIGDFARELVAALDTPLMPVSGGAAPREPRPSLVAMSSGPTTRVSRPQGSPTPVMQELAQEAPRKRRLLPLVGGVLVLLLLVAAAGMFLLRPVSRPVRTVSRPAATQQPAIPGTAGLRTLRDSALAVSEDMRTFRRAFARGDREAFQPAYARSSAILIPLYNAHRTNPAIVTLRNQMVAVRDTIRAICRTDASRCSAVGILPTGAPAARR